MYRLKYYQEEAEKDTDSTDNDGAKSQGESSRYSHIYKRITIERATWKTEIDEYFNDPRDPENTNILHWGKSHEKNYPTLAKMARDILCIPASSVPVGRFFSTGALVMNKRRTCLSDQSLKVLMCLNSWSKCSLKKEICDSD